MFLYNTLFRRTNYQQQQQQSMEGRAIESSSLVDGKRNWAELDRDCLTKIFLLAGLESLIYYLPLVCKSWYKASLDPICWKVLDFGMVPTKRTQWAHMFPDQSVRALPSTQYMKAALKWSRGATTKVVFYACNFEDNTLQYVLERCPELKTLILPCHEVSDKSKRQTINCLLKMIRKLKNLESLMTLKLSGPDLMNILIEIHSYCPNFVSLGVRGSISKDIVSAIVILFPYIKHLILKDSDLDRESLLYILSGCRNLQLLHVTSSRDFDADDAKILTLSSRIKDFKLQRSALCWDSDIKMVDAAEVVWGLLQ